MNSTGDTTPRCGCIQRSSASAPQGLRRREVELRLVGERELAALERVAQVERDLRRARGCAA